MTEDGGYPEEWDQHHPSEADEEWVEPENDDDPAVPTIDGQPEVVVWEAANAVRGPSDYVISGPLGEAGGHGRRFATAEAAWAWAAGKYGAERVRRVPPPAGYEEEATRWAILVRAS